MAATDQIFGMEISRELAKTDLFYSAAITTLTPEVLMGVTIAVVLAAGASEKNFAVVFVCSVLFSISFVPKEIVK